MNNISDTDRMIRLIISILFSIGIAVGILPPLSVLLPIVLTITAANSFCPIKSLIK